MNGLLEANGSPDPEAKSQGLPQWHRLYYLLVAFDVFTVSMSLFLNHQIMTIYVRSVEVNHAWVDRLQETSKLSQLAADVNAPGNDVFQSRQVKREAEKMRTSLGVFEERLETVRDEIMAHVGQAQAVPLVAGLQAAHQAMQAMGAYATETFDHLKNDRPKDAGESMAAMDRLHGKVNQALEHLRQDIGVIQREHFNGQTEAAASLHMFQYMIAAFILLMIAGAALYGNKIRKQLELEAREREGYIAALRRSEASLDQRVRERTGELQHANESLRKEIADRLRTEEALHQSKSNHRQFMESTAQMRRQLLQKVMSAQEDERRRIARDLHDEIGQALTSLLLGLRMVAEAPGLEAAHGRAEDLRRIAVMTLEEVRRLAHGLRPSVLDDMGLSAALERYAVDYSKAHGVSVEVEAAGLASERLPEEIETALYRIVQEALANTAKHAAAKNVHILLEREPSQVQMIIEDDGRGFDGGKAAVNGHLGLSGMRERAALLDGTLDVKSQPGHGTSIAVRIPLTARTRLGKVLSPFSTGC